MRCYLKGEGGCLADADESDDDAEQFLRKKRLMTRRTMSNAVELTTINSATEFHALFQTLSATQKGLCTPARGTVGRAKRSLGSWVKFTAEEKDARSYDITINEIYS